MRRFAAFIIILAGGLAYLQYSGRIDIYDYVGDYLPERAATTETETPSEEALTEEAPSEDERLNAFFAETFEAELMRSPIYLTYLSRTERQGEWDDFSDAAAMEETRIAQEELDRLHNEFDYDALSPQSQVSYLVFEHDKTSSIRSAEFLDQSYPDDMQNSWASWFTFVLTQLHAVNSVEDAQNYISRLENLEPAYAQLAEAARHRMNIGTIMPAFSYPALIEQMTSLTTGAPFDEGEDSLYLEDFRAKVEALEVDQDVKDQLINDAIAALEGPVARGFAMLIAAHEEGAALADGNHGIWNLPNGDRYYEERIANYTHSDMTADELHSFGLAEVERLQGLMREIMVGEGFEGTLEEFFRFLDTDPSNYYPNTDEGRQAFFDEALAQTERVMAAAPEYFNRMPVAPMEVRRIEEYRQDAEAVASYSGPAPDGSRPGIYWVNMRDMAEWPIHSAATTTFHEGVPGHHFHSALQQELEDIPDFQRYGGTTAFNEGWALYSERLAGEMGMHQTPLSEFGRLVGEIFRDARLVVDTGIHAKQWTREQSVAYMMANVGIPEGEVRSEIDRYFSWPGQALAYRMGQERILTLRARAQKELGEDFDIREFHEVVLSNGAVPMSVLELMIERYIAEKQAE